MADVPLMSNPMTTAGDVIYGGASGAPTRLGVGTAGQVLTVNAGATAPEWAAGGGGSFDPDEHMPWRIDINPLLGGDANTNWDTISTSASQYGGFALASSAAQNDEISFNVILAAGTWTVRLMHVKGTNRGIYSVQIDDSEEGTIDGYNGSAVNNARDSVAGITVASGGKHELSLKMLTKNASSSAYLGIISLVSLIRTA